MAPGLDVLGGRVAAPADVDTGDVAEEVVGVGPAVLLELPRLARREDGHDAVPVLLLELLGALDQDEAHRAVRVNVLAVAVDVQHGRARRRTRVGAVGGHELTALEERLDVGHAEEGGGRGRQEDDGVWALALLVERERRVGGDVCRRRRSLGHERCC